MGVKSHRTTGRHHLVPAKHYIYMYIINIGMENAIVSWVNAGKSILIHRNSIDHYLVGCFNHLENMSSSMGRMTSHI